MPFNSQQNIKRIIDILLAIVAATLLLPLIIIISLLVKFSSRGTIFFVQERVGMHGKTFMIWKFRSMYTTAEETGPQLSSGLDKRVTPLGKIIRRWRLDELPQLWNVLKGDMSIVGPRPERRFYIDQIVKSNPEYLRLLKLKPGLTSMGMVKFGYAENVNEMIERMRFDLAYAENPTFMLDFKIMLLSIKVVFAGKGK